MRRALQVSADQLRNELFSCIRQLLAAGDEVSVMRSFLYQTCMLQGSMGGLIGVNPSLATQPGAQRSGFRAQSIGLIEALMSLNHFDELSNGVVDSWDKLVSVVTTLGWSQSEPRFSKSFGTVGDLNFCTIFGYAIRSNFGDVLGFVVYVTPASDSLEFTDQNTTLIAQLSIFRLLEMVGVRQ